jgi:hypothetical protein
MTRREFATLVGGAAAAWPLMARGQQADRVRRIGVLSPFTEDDLEVQANITAFRQTLQKLGWNDAASWAMLIAPAKTPKPILTRLNAEVNAIVNTAEVKQQLVNLGLNPIGRGSLDELQAFVKAEVARWSKVVEEAGIGGAE